eukprot:365294-Chlamydomonas_euryale.AAC.10
MAIYNGVDPVYKTMRQCGDASRRPGGQATMCPCIYASMQPDDHVSLRQCSPKQPYITWPFKCAEFATVWLCDHESFIHVDRYSNATMH